MAKIFISNTCTGIELIKLNNIYPYNNPFISTFIPNDFDYIKLINNFLKYIYIEPILGDPSKNSLFAIQNNGLYCRHPAIDIKYPIIYLDDIEIHCIHEKLSDSVLYLEKFKRRLLRCQDIINTNNYKIIATLSFSELINDHNDLNILINEYLTNINNNLNIIKVFVGPSKYKNNYINYIAIDEWNNISLERNDSHVYIFNNQPFLANKINEYIKYL